MKVIHLLKNGLLFVFVVLLIGIVGCNTPMAVQEPSGETSGESDDISVSTADGGSIVIQAGDPVALGEGTLGTQGGVIRIENTGTALDGFQITAPQGALSEEFTFSVSSQEILNYELAPELEINLPMISVETSAPELTGAMFPGDLMEISLPVSLKADDFAMFFIYDEENGTLDALPLISQDETHLKAVTPHFSKIVIVEAEKPVLDRLNIKTGFVHGVNSWQFTNWGSFIAPGGHCAGQTVSAMFYYEMTGGSPLYGTYDATNNQHPPTPDFDFDDRLGYRLASVAQSKMNWKDVEATYWQNLQKGNDELAYYSLTLALRGSNSPQLVGIRRPDGGHALIAFEKFKDRFYISDPNYPDPSARRAIVYDRGTRTFKPYYSGPSAEDLGQAYPDIYYLNKTWFLSPLQMGSQWSEFENGTIGDDIFPKYVLLEYPPGVSNPDPLQFTIRDPYKVSSDNLVLKLHVDPAGQFAFKVFDESQTEIAYIWENADVNLVVSPGIKTYMFQVLGKVGDKWKYIDGQWIRFIQDYSGSWNSGPVCDEMFETRYRWQVSLIQEEDGEISGTIHFHNCPGGGQSVYHVTGSLKENQTLSLEGVKVGGAGALFDSTPAIQTFTIQKNQPPQPNFTP